MPLSASINGVPFDAKVAQTIARFTSISTNSNSEFTGPGWNGIEVVLQSGQTPGHATVQFSVSDSPDEIMPSMCGIDTSALNDIAIGDLCAIYAVIHNIEVLLFTGYVLDIYQNLTKDTATIALQDHRHALSGVPIIGSFIADVTGKCTYAHALAPYINPDNRPNCALGKDPIDGTTYPMFCQPDMGIKPGDLIDAAAPPFTPVVGKACYWSPKLFWQYLWWAYTSEGAAQAGAEFGKQVQDQDYVFTQVALELVWNAGLESALKGPLNAQINSERKCIQGNFQGQNLLTVLSNICIMYGQYGLDITPYSPTEGLLEIVNMTPLIDQQGNTNGEDILRYIDGKVQTQFEPGISGGSFNILGKDVNTRLLMSGETIYIETRVELIPDWSDQEQTDWAGRFADNGTPLDKQLSQANDFRPSVFCWYRIDTNKTTHNATGSDTSIQAGTTEDGYPLAGVGRPPLSKMLTSFLANASGVPLVGKMNNPYPIYFEVSYDGGTTWLIASGNTDFTVEPNGRIRLEGLRNTSLANANGTFKLSGGYPQKPIIIPLKVTKAKVRANFAIPLDHAVRSAKRLASDTDASNLPVQTNPDADYIANSYSRASFENLGGQNLYNYWIAKGSYPTPGTGAGVTNTIRNDLAYIATQTDIRAYQMLRIPKSGELTYPYILPQFRPGMSLTSIINQSNNSFSTYDLDAIVNRVTFTCGDFESTKLGLG